MKTNNSLFISLFLILFLFSSVCLAQNRANYNYNNSEYISNSGSAEMPSQTLPQAFISTENIIELEATVLMNVVADEYVAIFHTEQKGKKLKDVQENMDKRIANFQKGLIELGVKFHKVVYEF